MILHLSQSAPPENNICMVMRKTEERPLQSRAVQIYPANEIEKGSSQQICWWTLRLRQHLYRQPSPLLLLVAFHLARIQDNQRQTYCCDPLQRGQGSLACFSLILLSHKMIKFMDRSTSYWLCQLYAKLFFSLYFSILVTRSLSFDDWLNWTIWIVKCKEEKGLYFIFF